MTTHTATLPAESARDSGRWLIWTAGLIVAIGAAIATAHGLYRVALAATVPGPIAWLYPLITDGLALVAYASTTRLAAGGRRYAWAVVVLAAGLSGLAQASYLAIGVNTAPVQLRFGVGAWPAIAAAITAHLLYLLAAVRPETEPVRPDAVYAVRSGGVQPEPVRSVRSDAGAVRPDIGRTGRPLRTVRPDVRPVRSDTTHDRLSSPTPVTGTNTADHGRQTATGQMSGPNGPIPADPWAPAATDQDAATRRPSDEASDAAPDTGRPGRPDTVRPVRSDARPDAEHRSDQASDEASDEGTGRASDVGRSVRSDAEAARATGAAPDTARPSRPDTARRVEATGSPSVAAGSGSAGERARAAARAYLDEHHVLPTVAVLMRLADVGHGTAGEALRPLRDPAPAARPGLQIVRTDQAGTTPMSTTGTTTAETSNPAHERPR